MDRVTELAVLYEISAIPLRLLDFEQLGEVVVDKATRLLHSDVAVLYLYDATRGVLHPHSARGISCEQIPSLPLGEADAGIRQAIIARQPLTQSVQEHGALADLLGAGYPVQAMICVPVRSGDELLGMIYAGRLELSHYSEVELPLFAVLADRAAFAVENMRLLAATRRRAEEAETLRHAAAVVAASLDEDDVITRILEQLERVVPYETAAVLTVRAHGVEVLAFRGVDGSHCVQGVTFESAEQHLVRDLLTQKRAVHDLDPRVVGSILGGDACTSMQSWLGVPLVYKEQAVGMLIVGCTPANHFTSEHIRMLVAFADHVAIAMENTRLYAVEKRRAREFDALYTATTALLTTLDLETLLQRVLEEAGKAIPAAEKGSILLLDHDTKQLQVRAVLGYSDPRVKTFAFPQSEGFAAKAVREKRPLLLDDVRSDPTVRYDGDISEVRRIGSAIAAPLKFGNQVLGVITLDSERWAAFSSDDLQLLVTFAATVTAAIHNTQLHAAVQEMALTDYQTGFYNRRGFYELADKEVERSRRRGHPLSVLMLDLDRFKRINDNHGHMAGDQVLLGLAACCEETLRKVDLVGRYGGDEYVALLPETGLDAARIVAERLHRRIVDMPMETEQGPISVTVSIGVASYDADCLSLDALLERADQALYAAKQAGRNRVYVWCSDHTVDTGSLLQYLPDRQTAAD